MLKTIQKLRFSGKKEKKLAETLYLLLGFYPKNILLYQQALRHSSVSKEIKQGVRDSNERLEYLGDAILGSIIAEYLFQLYPFKGEGFLTQMRSRIVNRSQLNHLALKLGLNKLIKADLRGTRAGSMNGDAFEALIGAIYLDRGYKKTRKFVLERILKIHLDIEEIEQTDTDYKSKLINICQKEKKKVVFNLLDEVGKGMGKEFVVQVEIDGHAIVKFQHTSKRRAEQLAAQLALEKLAKR
ncbi:MAG: ribonuclease III [Bacteroidia bacterium]